MKHFIYPITLLPVFAFGETYYPYQARAIDGDTLEIIVRGQSSERVRLLGIDAPESGQDFGSRSRQALAECIQNGITRHNLRIDSTKKDRYGRLLGVVYAGDIDCNLNQIQLGLAWHYKYYAKDQTPAMQSAYAQAEYHAYTARRGLWSMCATAPWRYRRGERGCDVPDFNASNLNVATPANTQNNTRTLNQVLSPNATCATLKTATCKQMSDCATARQALACGNTRIDGDNDGVPCEALCR